MSEQLTSLGIIPDDWEVATLGDISIKMTNGFVGIATPYYSEDENGVPYLYGNNVRAGRLDFRKLFRVTSDFHRSQSKSQLATGDMLTVQSGHIGTTAIVPASLGLANCHALIITRLRAEFAHPEFVAYCCNSAHGMQRMAAYFVGSTIAHINVKDLKSYLLPLPPLWQQRKIARILTTVDNLIEKTESLIAKYQAVKQGMMHDLFTRGVDAHGKLRPPQSEAPELYKQSELGWIPKDWKSCRVDEVGAIKLGRQRSPKHQSGRFTTPYLRVANVFDGFIDYSDILQMDFTPTEKETYSLIQGDVLLNEGQSLELVGRSAIYEGEPNRFCFQNTLIRFRSYPPNDPYFCRGIFKFYIDIGRFMTIARQTTSVAHLGADRLAKLEFPCPHPDEQVRIAAALRQQEKHCELERKYKNNLIQQKSGLMQDLLTGRVRVNVDESEEIAVHG